VKLLAMVIQGVEKFFLAERENSFFHLPTKQLTIKEVEK